MPVVKYYDGIGKLRSVSSDQSPEVGRCILTPV
jgi:hypothetical protein